MNGRQQSFKNKKPLNQECCFLVYITEASLCTEHSTFTQFTTGLGVEFCLLAVVCDCDNIFTSFLVTVKNKIMTTNYKHLLHLLVYMLLVGRCVGTFSSWPVSVACKIRLPVKLTLTRLFILQQARPEDPRLTGRPLRAHDR